jgi:hypothetical protein
MRDSYFRTEGCGRLGGAATICAGGRGPGSTEFSPFIAAVVAIVRRPHITAPDMPTTTAVSVDATVVSAAERIVRIYSPSPA